MAMILITHDLGVVAGRTDEVAVMYAGRVVERAPTPALFKKMRMPYTEALLAAIPNRRRSAHALAGDIRTAAGPDPADPGLLVFAALPLRRRPMSSREALARRRGIAGPPVRLLPPD
jgi:ABC-type glutathione transport system ATPase component